MNKLYKALIYDREVSLSVLECTDMVNDAIKTHNLDEGSAKTLGSLLIAATYMAGCLKSERGAISITVKGGDSSSTASVSGDIDLHIRGYIDGNYSGKISGGYMTVIKDDGFYRPFVGASELVGDDVSENLMKYFQMSEQIDTAVAIGVNIKNGKCTSAGGVVMQLLPGTSEENMQRAEDRMQSFVNISEAVERLGADGIMEEYFKGLVPENEIYLLIPEYKCNCSRKKLANVIKALGKEELIKIIEEEGKVVGHCHYCNTDYEFYKEDVDKLF